MSIQATRRKATSLSTTQTDTEVNGKPPRLATSKHALNGASAPKSPNGVPLNTLRKNVMRLKHQWPSSPDANTDQAAPPTEPDPPAEAPPPPRMRRLPPRRKRMPLRRGGEIPPAEHFVQILEAEARKKGWDVALMPAEGNKDGFPDMMLRRGHELLFRRLGDHDTRLTAQQMAWNAALERHGIHVETWNRSDWPNIRKQLQTEAERRGLLR